MKIYSTLKSYLTILARCPKHKATMYIMDYIVAWLRHHKEDKGADWLAEYWCGERGNWDMGSAGIGCPNANCGVESGWGRIRKAVCSGLRSFSYAQFMTVFLNYETDQSVDDMSKHKHSGCIFFPSAPKFLKSTWHEVCDMTAVDLRLMTVGVYDTNDNYLRGIQTVHDLSVRSDISFIRAAMAISSEAQAAPLSVRDALCLIFPSDYMLEMFSDEPDYFQSHRYEVHISKLSPCSTLTFFPSDVNGFNDRWVRGTHPWEQ